MRIISGSLKGRRIVAPKKLPVRPTTDMAKESLFNILNNRYYFDELNVLDLFAGTGNISYEFASRGSEVVHAVDKDPGCYRFIDKTAKELELPIDCTRADVFKYLESTRQTYDIIFADPPYDFSKELFAKIPELVFENDLLNAEGTLIVEHSKHTDLSDLPHYDMSKKYGGNVFSFFEKKADL